MQPLAERVFRWRKVRGFTQAKLARAVGVAPSTVALWERGVLEEGEKEPGPHNHNFRQMCRVLNVTEAEFWGELPELPEEKPAKEATQ